MYRTLPNQLTVLRLVLAGVFFVALNQYRYVGHDVAAVNGTRHWLWVAFILFLLAVITDALDGYLARKWQGESTFGRIMDPFCDKVLILGAFIFLAGPRFAASRGDTLISVSSVYPWMVAVMLARELLVTGVRGELEGAGVQFGANIFGKAKMILQSIAVPVILGVVWLDPIRYESIGTAADLLMYVIVVVTVASGAPYVTKAGAAMRQWQK